MINKQAIEKAHNDPSFKANGWLTFCLVGSVKQHREMASGLRELGAINLSEGIGGAVYAKVPVAVEETAILRCVEQVLTLAETMAVQIAVVDLDASPDVGESKFYTLWLAK